MGEEFPRALIDVLQHIILSHHGQPEFGAARTPSTPEAIAVHMIENMDAKLMMSLSVTRQQNAPAGEGNWTEYMKAFGGRLYRPDLAPPDPALVQAEAVEQAAAAAAAKAEPAPPATKPPAAKGEPAAPKLIIDNPLFETVAARKK
jgi:3'-5' exoribonuclease